jgi:hypothetical protein
VLGFTPTLGQSGVAISTLWQGILPMANGKWKLQHVYEELMQM